MIRLECINSAVIEKRNNSYGLTFVDNPSGSDSEYLGFAERSAEAHVQFTNFIGTVHQCVQYGEHLVALRVIQYRQHKNEWTEKMLEASKQMVLEHHHLSETWLPTSSHNPRDPVIPHMVRRVPCTTVTVQLHRVRCPNIETTKSY